MLFKKLYEKYKLSRRLYNYRQIGKAVQRQNSCVKFLSARVNNFGGISVIEECVFSFECIWCGNKFEVKEQIDHFIKRFGSSLSPHVVFLIGVDVKVKHERSCLHPNDEMGMFRNQRNICNE